MSPQHATTNRDAGRARRLARTVLPGPVAAGILTMALVVTQTPVSTAWTWALAGMIVAPVWILDIRHALRSSTDTTLRFGVELCAGSALVGLGAWAIALTVAITLIPLGQAAVDPDYARHLAALIAIVGAYTAVGCHFLMP